MNTTPLKPSGSILGRLSLRTKLIAAFLVVAAICTAGLGFMVNRVLQAELQQQISANLNSLAQSQDLTLGAEFSKQVDLLETLGYDPGLEQAAESSNQSFQTNPTTNQAAIDPQDKQWRAADAANNDADPLVQAVLSNSVSDLLRAFRKANPDHVEVFATDQYGRNVAATNRTSDYYQADEEWWQKAYNSGKGAIYIGQPEYDASSHTYAVNMAVPIVNSATGQLVGVLRTTYSVSALAKFLASVRFGQTGDASLIFPSGELLKSNGDRAVLDAATLAQIKGTSGMYAQLVYDGRQRIVSQTPFTSLDPQKGKTISDLDWTLVVTQDPAEALRPLNVATQTTLLIGLAALLIALLLGAFIAQYLTSPIVHLTALSEQVQAGDLRSKARVESQDEIGILAETFNRMISRLQELQTGLEQQVETRTAQLKAVNEVGRVASSILDPQELVAQVVHLISDQFGYYYAAIFLTDEQGEWAMLHDATGEAGRVLKENKHRLRVGGNSMVGTAISMGQPRIAQDVGAEPIRFENPLLPYTRSEIALPLVVGQRVLGALDVQSTKQSAFGSQEIETLQSMAHQVGIAFENARLFQEAQKRLAEMQAIQRQYVFHSWAPLAGNENLEYKIGDEDSGTGAAEVDVPLALRDEIIGQISLTTGGDWTPEQRNLIEAVASQAALALENARLVEESQSSAARERLVAEITGKVWSATTIDGILQTAVRELGRALDASEASIELKMENDNG